MPRSGPAAGAHRRLTAEQRRDQLLDVGAALFAERAYEAVLMEEVAEGAGVTRALVYHYFPTKHDLYIAIFQRASDRLLATATPAGTRSWVDRLHIALDAHIQYFVDHPGEAITVNRGAMAGDPEIQSIIGAELAVVGQQIVDSLEPSHHDRATTVLAVHGWLAFARAVCVEWTLEQTIPRDELTELCLRAFSGSVRRLDEETVTRRR